MATPDEIKLADFVQGTVDNNAWKKAKAKTEDGIEIDTDALLHESLLYQQHHIQGASAQVDRSLTQKDWETTVAAYTKTGNNSALQKKTQLDRKQVEHLLNIGVVRLGLPAIRPYLTDKAKVNLKLHEHAKEQTTAIQKARDQVTDRVAQEALAAQRLLRIGQDLNTVMEAYTQSIIEALSQGRLETPETITKDDLLNLTKALDAHSKIIERAVKLQRLTAGEPTELLGVQIGMMLNTLTPEESRVLAQTGEIPARLRGKVGTQGPTSTEQERQNMTNQPAIDVDYEEIGIQIDERGRNQ